MNRARDTDNIEQCKLIGREAVGALFVTDNRGRRQFSLYIISIGLPTAVHAYLNALAKYIVPNFLSFLTPALIDRGMYAMIVYNCVRLTVFTAVDFRSTLHRLYYL